MLVLMCEYLAQLLQAHNCPTFSIIFLWVPKRMQFLTLFISFKHYLYFYLWTSSMAQQVKNLPAREESQKMRVPSLGQEDPGEKGPATHFLA